MQQPLPEFWKLHPIQFQDLHHIGCLQGISAPTPASPVQLSPNLDQQDVDWSEFEQPPWAYPAWRIFPLAQFGLAAPALLEGGALLDAMLL